jgi:hypothetical protein
MVKLRTLKFAAALREHTALRPVLRCETRWNGAFNMVRRFLDILESIRKVKDADKTDTLDGLMLKSKEIENLKVLHKSLVDWNAVFLEIQKRDCSMLKVRKFFDHILRSVPSMSRYLSPEASVIHNPAFETALVKLQKRVFFTSCLNFSRISPLIFLFFLIPPIHLTIRQF